MSLLHEVKRVARFLRRPIGPPAGRFSFISSTLDPDDIKMAIELLGRDGQVKATGDCEKFHDEFAAWNGSRFAFSFSAGRVALSAIIHALGLVPGDEVVIPGYTCIVVLNAFRFAGLRVRFCDIELDTYGLDAKCLSRAIGASTKAVMLHHLYGLVCRDYDSIYDLANKFNLRVIEDCAHSTGAMHRGARIGTRGDAAFYSSEYSKIFNTRMGGVAVTNDPGIAAGIKRFYELCDICDDRTVRRQLAALIGSYYQHKHNPHILARFNLWRLSPQEVRSTQPDELNGVQPKGYASRMPQEIAAIARNQLKKIDAYNSRRRKAAERWNEWCITRGYTPPLVLAETIPVFLRYPVLVEPERKLDLSWSRREVRADVGNWFTSQAHPTAIVVPGCPKAEEAVKRCINLPTLLNGHCDD